MHWELVSSESYLSRVCGSPRIEMPKSDLPLVWRCLYSVFPSIYISYSYTCIVHNMCYIMLYYGILYYIVSYYDNFVITYYFVLFYIGLYYVTLYYSIASYDIVYYIIF